MEKRAISLNEALTLINREESQFWDHKSSSSGGAVFQKIASALANTDGGEFIVGIEDSKKGTGIERWSGFNEIEDSNPIHQALTAQMSPSLPYSYEYLVVEGFEKQGIACLVRIDRAIDVHYTAAHKAFIRKGASSLEISGQAATNLQLAKGAKSYEDQLLSEYLLEDLEYESELKHFLDEYSPMTNARDFAVRERIVNRKSGECRVAAAVLYAESPPAVTPKRCAIKISRYNTSSEPRREHLAFPPITVEGPARLMIEQALIKTTDIFEAVNVLQTDGSLVPMKYPPETLKEIVVNAVIHRDYNIPDDVHISIFDNRVEVRSPGGLPGQMTLQLLFKERASRNPKILRLLNKYPNPLNQDVGEGLRTAREKMLEAKLKEPRFDVDGNYFVVTLPHERLARPEEVVMEYLESHSEITNKIARNLTGIQSENSMKEVFYSLRDVNKLERVPGKNGNKAAWRSI